MSEAFVKGQNALFVALYSVFGQCETITENFLHCRAASVTMALASTICATMTPFERQRSIAAAGFLADEALARHIESYFREECSFQKCDGWVPLFQFRKQLRRDVQP